MSITRECKKCGVPFSIPYKSYQKYTCSEQCARDYGVKTCRFCGDDFYSRSHNQVLCSDKCKQEEWQKLRDTGESGSGTKLAVYYKLRFDVLKRDGFKCQYCGRSPRAEEGVVLHIDHLVAKHRGGDDSIGNLVTACEACNLGKSDYILTKREMDIMKRVV